MLFEVMDSPDKRLRRELFWQGIIIHHTSIGGRKEISESLWETLSKNIAKYLATKDDNYASAHYIIARNGKITRLVDPDFYEAWHAGKSNYWHPKKRQFVDDWNRYAIGIEIVGDGNLHEYSEAQYKALIELTKYLMNRYESIHPLCITGHENICHPHGRKDDPGKYFNWKRYFGEIYGSERSS